MDSICTIVSGWLQENDRVRQLWQFHDTVKLTLVFWWCVDRTAAGESPDASPEEGIAHQGTEHRTGVYHLPGTHPSLSVPLTSTLPLVQTPIVHSALPVHTCFSDLEVKSCNAGYINPIFGEVYVPCASQQFTPSFWLRAERSRGWPLARGQWIGSALPAPAKSAVLTASSSKVRLGRELIARHCRHSVWLWLKLGHFGRE